MAEIVPQAAQTADDYEDRITAAVKMVLVEIGQILGSFRGKFAVIGGSVPWLLLEDSEMEHVGTVDVDLNLHAEALQNGEYADLIGSLMAIRSLLLEIGVGSGAEELRGAQTTRARGE